jgi:hypothetical protein
MRTRPIIVPCPIGRPVVSSFALLPYLVRVTVRALDGRASADFGGMTTLQYGVRKACAQRWGAAAHRFRNKTGQSVRAPSGPSGAMRVVGKWGGGGVECDERSRCSRLAGLGERHGSHGRAARSRSTRQRPPHTGSLTTPWTAASSVVPAGSGGRVLCSCRTRPPARPPARAVESTHVSNPPTHPLGFHASQAAMPCAASRAQVLPQS